MLKTDGNSVILGDVGLIKVLFGFGHSKSHFWPPENAKSGLELVFLVSSKDATKSLKSLFTKSLFGSRRYPVEAIWFDGPIHLTIDLSFG